MAQTNDSLQLMVKESDYDARIGQLDSKMNELQTILADYKTLKDDAVKVFGEDDQNLQAIQKQVQNNIDVVQGQYNMLKETRDMLQKQREELNSLGTNIGQTIDEAVQTAKSSFNTIKIIGDLVN